MSNLSAKEYQVLIDQFITASDKKYGTHSYAAGYLGATLASLLASPSKESSATVLRYLINAIDAQKSP